MVRGHMDDTSLFELSVYTQTIDIPLYELSVFMVREHKGDTLL